MNGRVIINDELVKMWKEDVAYFEVLSQYLSGENDENQEKYQSQDSQLPGQELNLV
jgi:hypothetical protein